MPFKSKAQRRKFAELLVKGEISEEGAVVLGGGDSVWTELQILR
jgi:hypothetical protein